MAGAVPKLLQAEEPASSAEINAADTSFMLFASALVLLMTPGLAFFYGGLVRRKNVLSILMQCFICICLVTVLWVVVGFSLAFGETMGRGFVGNPTTHFLLRGIANDRPWKRSHVPQVLFVVYQCMFATITPALILGAYAERIRFGGFCAFTALWLLLCYTPVCHWAWGGGYFHGSSGGPLMRAGEDSIDFAGGTVVHLNAGVAALACVLRLGSRRGYPDKAPLPHNLPLAVLGAAMLWFGWFGFTTGVELAPDATSAGSILATQVSAAMAGLSWALLEHVLLGRATVLGVISGNVAGLVAITPSCGSIGVGGALVVGTGATVVAYLMVTNVKACLNYDDSLDVCGLHGAAGLWGSLAAGMFSNTVRGDGSPVAGPAQVWVQAKSVLATVVYTGSVTLLIMVLVEHTVGMRAAVETERVGLDLADHAECAYNETDDDAFSMT